MFLEPKIQNQEYTYRWWSGNEVKGVISLQNIDRENAFSDSDVRLLETLANSMSVALENARLFDETQRLLKESEQRATELSIINEIQQGLAAELDFQAIVDLVGDKLSNVFKLPDVGIYWYDENISLAPLSLCYRTWQAPRHSHHDRPNPVEFLRPWSRPASR